MTVPGSTIWGQTLALLDRTRKFGWVDLLGLVAVLGILYGVLDLAHQWHGDGDIRQRFEIDLSPLALPRYTFFSLCRGLLAYLFSLSFTLVYGYWAAKDRVAEPLLVTMLDILQSIPVLGFMPGLVLALQALFPHSNVGLELAAILMIFTGQAWNMTFSFYYSVKGVPSDLREVATVYGFNWWEVFRKVELPFATIGLVWNSMMSMAGGWFFLMINETFVLGDEDFSLPGVGSYAAAAVKQGDFAAMVWAVLAMVLMIVLLDQLLWRPVVVWSQKFRVEEGGSQPQMTSWFLLFLRRSRLLAALHDWAERRAHAKEAKASMERVDVDASPPRRRLRALSFNGAGRWKGSSLASLLFFLALLGVLGFAALHLILLLIRVPLSQWGEIVIAAILTLMRVLAAVALGTLWALPAGITIGLSPRLSRILQPVVQVAASFPAPMLFPLVILILDELHVSLGWGSVVLMMLGTQWYILFNCIAGAMAIPSDLQEMARTYGIKGWQRYWTLYFPAVFPYLVTGWVTAAGGAWNASIVSEYVVFKQRPLEARGLGAEISKAAAGENFPLLAASVVVMSLLVVLFNRMVWHRLYHLAQTRFALTK